MDIMAGKEVDSRVNDLRLVTDVDGNDWIFIAVAFPTARVRMPVT